MALNVEQSDEIIVISSDDEKVQDMDAAVVVPARTLQAQHVETTPARDSGYPDHAPSTREPKPGITRRPQPRNPAESCSQVPPIQEGAKSTVSCVCLN
jgi:hypothetical protein